MSRSGERLISAAKEMRRETILAKVWKNPPTSKRYVPMLRTKSPIDMDIRVYDQVEQRFVEDDELATIDVDAKMRLP